MRKAQLFLLATLILGLVAGATVLLRQDQEKLPTVTVYKSPTCGCCTKWVEHLKANGFETKVTDMPDVNPMKARLGVPVPLGSCHTAVVGGYVVEGHVPADVIKKMLSEKPEITGIAVPGMPTGSPGMEVEGRPAQKYNILAFTKDGKHSVYASR